MGLAKEEIKAVEMLFPFLSQHPTIVDVGTNKGEWSDVILNEFKENCIVHFFEPNDIMLNYCRIKYDYNKNIVYNSLAVCDVAGKEIPFYYFENYNNGLSSIYENAFWHEEDLPMKEKKARTITIDNYCTYFDIDTIDFLKIDCEGADTLVLKGSDKMLSENKIKIIQIEYGSHYKLGSHTFKEVIERLSGYGYLFYSFTGENFVNFDSKSFIEDWRFENFYITKYNIANHDKWNTMFIENTKDLGKFELIIEVGAAHGQTTKYMCENMLEENGRLIAIDPLLPYYLEPDDNPIFKNQYELFLRNTKGLPVDLYRDKSEVVLPQLHTLRAQFTYVDGNHGRAAVRQDGIDVFKITKIGYYILFDDFAIEYGYGETNAGIKEFLQTIEGKYEIVKENYQLLIKKIAD